jgi:hypothetical protein
MANMSMPMANMSDLELQQYLGTAWATARLLGATFAENCWGNLTDSLRNGIQNTPSSNDPTGSNASPVERVALVHARIARLVTMMYEEALKAGPPMTLAPQQQIVVLHEFTLSNVLDFKLCLWPFWDKGC